MKENQTSYGELLRMEIMERYGLREDQVRLELSISTTDLNQGRQILADFNNQPEDTKFLLPKDAPCDKVYGEVINTVWVHRKDGFYGHYINEDGEDNE